MATVVVAAEPLPGAMPNHRLRNVKSFVAHLFGKLAVLFAASRPTLQPIFTVPASADAKMIPLKSKLDINDLRQAFDDLYAQDPAVVNSFRDSFVRRARKPDLPEAQTATGLASAVASSLYGPMTKTYLARFHSHKPNWNGNRPPTDPEFRTRFLYALDQVSEHDPGMLNSLEFLLEQNHCSIRDFLAARFLFYVDNQEVYPF